MWYLGVAVVCAIIGYVVGSGKGRGGLGAILGAVLGVIGVIIVAVMGPAPELEAATRGEGPGIGSGPSASKQLSVEERLSKLDQLRASGAIDEAEYKAERQRVLSAV